MSSGHYVLGGQSGRDVEECDNHVAWQAWYSVAGNLPPGAHGSRTIARTQVGPYCVSTFFLGTGPQFETRVFGVACEKRLCNDWDEAEAQHYKIVRLLLEWLDGGEIVHSDGRYLQLTPDS